MVQSLDEKVLAFNPYLSRIGLATVNWFFLPSPKVIIASLLLLPLLLPSGVSQSALIFKSVTFVIGYVVF